MKIIIINDDGDIVRAVNLPYKGIHIDVTDTMPDHQFDIVLQNLHSYSVELEGKGEYKKDEKGHPIIKLKP